MVTYPKISPQNGEPQRYSWGTQKKKKKKKKKWFLTMQRFDKKSFEQRLDPNKQRQIAAQTNHA